MDPKLVSNQTDAKTVKTPKSDRKKREKGEDAAKEDAPISNEASSTSESATSKISRSPSRSGEMNKPNSKSQIPVDSPPVKIARKGSGQNISIGANSSNPSNSPSSIPMTIGSPSTISTGILISRKSSRPKLPTIEDDSPHSSSNLSPNPINIELAHSLSTNASTPATGSPRHSNRNSLDWTVSPRQFQSFWGTAVAADPALSYIPTRIFITSQDRYLLSLKSMQGESQQLNSGRSVSPNRLAPNAPSSPNILNQQSSIDSTSTSSANSQPTPPEFIAVSVGKSWNLTTLLLVSAEKLGMEFAASCFLHPRQARIVSLNDLREGDEIVICPTPEGLSAANSPSIHQLETMSQANSSFNSSNGSSASSIPFVLSPTATKAASARSRIGSAPISMDALPLTPVSPKSDSAPKSRTTVYGATSTAPRLSGIEPGEEGRKARKEKQPSNDDIFSNGSGGSTPKGPRKRISSSANLFAANPVGGLESSSSDSSASAKDSIFAQRKKNSKGTISTPTGLTISLTQSGLISASSSGYVPKSSKTPSPRDERRPSTPKSSRPSSIAEEISSSRSSTGKIRRNPSRLISAREDRKDKLWHGVYSTPITSDLPLEGRPLIRRATTTFLDHMRNEEIKVNAVAAIRDFDPLLGISCNHPIITNVGGTSKSRRFYNPEVLYVELRRSHSTPEVWLRSQQDGPTGPMVHDSFSNADHALFSYPSNIHGSNGVNSEHQWGAISHMSVLSTPDEESEASMLTIGDDDNDSESDTSSIASTTSGMFDLTSRIGDDDDDHDGMHHTHPLMMSEQDIIQRMKVEEKQDVENIMIEDEQVQAGTLRALIRRLFWHYQEDDFIDFFLLTYDQFIGHMTLLKTLIMLFRVPFTDDGKSDLVSQSTVPGSATPSVNATPSKSSKNQSGSNPPKPSKSSVDVNTPPVSARAEASHQQGGLRRVSTMTATSGMKTVIQFRILNLLKSWIDWRYETLSLKSNKEFFQMFYEFCDFLGQSSFEKHRMMATQLQSTVKLAKRTRLLHRRNMILTVPPKQEQSPKTSYVGDNSTTSFTKVTHISVRAWAEYFTLREQGFFGKIKLKEYRNGNFNSKDEEKNKRSPDLQKQIKHFNKISYWIATSIFRCEGLENTPKSRGSVISHWLQVMDELRSMQNFNSMLSIFSALNMVAVSRLEKTWAMIKSEDRERLTKVQSLIDHNYKDYRKHVEFAKPPCIPITEVTMRDLTFIEENPTILPNGWINFGKILMLGKAYKALKKFQNKSYEFKYTPGVHNFFKIHGNMNEEEMFDYSKLIEPSANDLEKIAKAESEKKDAAKREKKYRDLLQKYAKKMPAKSELAQLITSDMTLEHLIVSPEACAAFKCWLDTNYDEGASLEYYRTWFTEWKTLPFSESNADATKKIKEQAEKMYETFFGSASSQIIALNNQAARSGVIKAVKFGTVAITSDLFDAVNTEISQKISGFLSTFRKRLTGPD